MATTLGLKRFLAAILAAAVAIPAAATVVHAGGNWMPLLPDQDFYDFQLFAPPDLHEYAVRPPVREGIFLSYDRLYWGLTPPPVRGVGNRDFFVTEPLSPDMIVRLNNTEPQGQVPPFIVYGTPESFFDLNTSWMMTEMTWGNRYDIGWIYDDVGFAVRYFNLQDQNQSFTTLNEFAVNSPQQDLTIDITPPADFLSPGFVTVEITNTSPAPDHLISQQFTQRNSTELQSVAVATLIRRTYNRTTPVTFSLAGRFVQLTDRFSMDYQSEQKPFPSSPDSLDYDGPLQQGSWETRTFNNMVGPELGLNWEKTAGRWTLGLDLRFTPAMNFQNNLYRGANFPKFLAADYVRTDIVSGQVEVVPGQTGGTVTTTNNLPLLYQVYGTRQDNATNSAEHSVVFAPIGEWTLETRFRVSQAVLLRLGYTGTWMAGIARASTNTAFVSTPQRVRVAEPLDPTRPPQTNSGAPEYNPWVAKDRVVEYTTVRPAAGDDQTYVFMNGVNFGVEVSY
jgi:hypothetical protein